MCENLGGFTAEEDEEEEEEEEEEEVELDGDEDPGPPTCNTFEQCGQLVLMNRQSML